MSLISFDPNINQQLEQRQEILNQLKSQKSAARFQYPSADEQFQFDQLNYLLPFKWDGIDAPLLSLATAFTRDVVAHKFVNIGGALLEDTGRNPLIINAEIVFVNTIVPGGNEGWIQGTLYPDVYNQFLMSLLDVKNGGTTRTLSHPQLGNIPCKINSFSTQVLGAYRGGAIISAQFTEDNLDVDNTNQLFQELNKTSDDIVTLQQDLLDLSPDPLALQLIPVAGGLTGLLNSIKAIVDTGSLIGQDALGSIQSISYRCNTIINSIKLANNMIYAKVINTAYLVRADSVFLAERFEKDIPIKINKVVNTYKTSAITTLSALAQILNNSVESLMNLNPFLLSTPYVAAGSIVRYYTGNTETKLQGPSL